MHIAGLIFAAIGLGFLFYAMRARARWQDQAFVRRDSEVSASLATLNEVMPGIVNFGLVVAGAQICFLYFAMGVGDRFSLVDLGGFLFLLVCYGTSVTMQARLRRQQAS